MASRNILLGSSRTVGAFSRPAGLQLRCLSSTASREAQHKLIRFNFTNPGLYKVLETIREKIIARSYLDETQAKKVHSYKYAKELETDPIVVEVDGEEFKFGYINPKTLPNTNVLVQQAVDQMKTKKDLSNVIPLLEGLKQAKRSLDWRTLPKVVRRAGLADALNVIVDAAVAVERTNFRLIHSETVNQLLCWIQKKALDSGWDKKETIKALNVVNKLLDVMEERKENDTSKAMTWAEGMTLRKTPLYRDPQVLAARLHLAAVLAVKYHGGQDTDGVVAKYASEVVSLWPQDAGLLDIHPKPAYNNGPDMGYLTRQEGRNFVWFAAPILHGFKLAAQVVEPGLASALLNRAEVIEKEIKESKPALYETIYDELFSPGKTEAEKQEEEA